MKKFLTLLLITSHALLFAQTEADIDALFQLEPGSPGAVVGIFETGGIRFAKGYGLANLDYDIPITTKTVFDIGSVSKQFTAACIFLLEQQQRLSIDDPIQMHLPEIPVYHGETVRIRHLINHTSGLRDYVELMAYEGTPYENLFTEDQGLEMMARQKDRNFPPGTQFMYNNGGYLLLAIIVRRVSGMSIGAFAQKNIFDPLGMKHTFILENPARVVKNSATGYAKNEAGVYEKQHYYNFALGGDGQVYTTLEDLLLWDNNFYAQKVGGQALHDRMHEQAVLNNGQKIDYAGGLFIQTHKGEKMVQHSGSWGGFRSLFFRFPDRKVSLVILTNAPDVLAFGNVYPLLDKVLSKDDTHNLSPLELSTVNVPTKKLIPFTGTYEAIKQPQLRWSVTLENDTLRVTQAWNELSFQILPISSSEFFRKDVPDIRFSFLADASGPLIRDRLEDIQTRKTDPYLDDPSIALTKFTGTFFSTETNTKYTLSVQDKLLVLQRGKDFTTTLQRVSQLVFRNKMQGFQFVENENGIQGFFIQDRRIRNLWFERMKS